MKKAGALFVTLVFSLFMVHNTLGYAVNTVSFGDGVDVVVEVAQTTSEQQNGLMHRENLEEGSGMMFIFESESRYGFWMKNMNFPIDIIWIDSGFRVVDVLHAVPPCTMDPCKSYSPERSARYVLEVPSGFAEKNNIDIGHRMELDYVALEQ